LRNGKRSENVTEFAAFVDSCVRAGGIFGSLCALIVVPVLIWLFCRVLSPQIHAMTDDPRWQAPLAAAGTALPGAIFLLISSVSMIRGFASMCWHLPAGRALLSTIMLLTLYAIARAVWLTIRRSAQARSLVRRAVAPSERLARIARACGIITREIDIDAPLCALVGTGNPIVLVSRGTLAILSDAELSAALRHERAHADHADHILGGVVAFFADLLPLPSRDLQEVYRAAREVAADRAATGDADATDLASAIVAMMKRTQAIAMAVPLVGSARSTATARVRSLLFGPAKMSNLSGPRRLAVATMLALLFAFGATATVAASQPASCALTLQSQSR
jgi:Zn-dependent protease with chaperone function